MSNENKPEKLNEKIDNLTNITNSIKSLISSISELSIVILPILGAMAKLFDIDNFKNFLITHSLLPENSINFISDHSTIILCLFLLLTSVIFTIHFIISIKKTSKNQLETNNNSYNVTYNIVNKLHNDFIHKLRDATYNLYLKEQRIIELRKTQNTEAIKEVQERAFDSLISNLQSFVDSIADYLSEYNNKDKISVCIKIINPGQDNIADSDKKAKTLVRSKNTKKARSRTNENITLGKNTDFKHLCDGTNIWYHGVDLKTKYENGEYENEAPVKDWQSKYNSTIVVPIRYYINDDDILVNDILGFLCIDSKKIVTTWDDTEPFELQYLAIFADSLYTYIKFFRRLF